jgi:hypothetical protein
MNKQRPVFNLRKHLITLFSLLLLIVLLICLRQNPVWIERYYFTWVYKVVSYVLHPVLGLLPFSIGDIIYMVAGFFLVAGIITLFAYLFRGKFQQLGQLALRFVIALEVAWLWFYCFWGLNYYRPPAAQLLNLNDTTYTIKDVAKVTALIIDSANACRARLDTMDMHQDNSTIYQHATDAVNKPPFASEQFKAIAPRLKPSWYSYLLNYMGISGYFNPFTGESQINYLMPVHDKPFVACHEMAHQTGWAREDEANFAGFTTGTNADDMLLRYSSYYAGVEEFMRYLRRRDTAAHHALRLKISPLVMQDFKTDSAYWVKYEGGAEVVSGIFLDKFFKANNQPHGLHTYNRMILLTMAYYRKQYHIW